MIRLICVWISIWSISVILSACENVPAQDSINTARDMHLGSDVPLKPTDMNLEAGSMAGEQAGEMAGEQAGEMAGEQAGEMAGEQAGSMAGEQAGSMAGEQAGEMAGEQAGMMWAENDWPLRHSCDLVLESQVSNANQVRFAAPFTFWGEQALNMTPQGNGVFQMIFNPYQGVGREIGLQEGERYPYKFIVDDVWKLDPNNQLRQYDNECINSAFEMPRCSEPAIQVQEMNYGADGQLSVRIDLLLARVINNGAIDTEATISQPASFSVTLDGQTIPFQIQANIGQLWIDHQGLSAGKHKLELSFIDQSGQQSNELSIPFWIESQAFDWRDTVLYMFMVDRFANGDMSNDQLIDDPNVPYSINWHGGDLQGALTVLESGYFEELGVKAIWLSPINEQVDGTFEDRNGIGRQFASYHGYWPVKARDIDHRYGGAEGLRNFIQAAHQRGIRVLLDLINNQVHEQHEYYQNNPEWFRTSCVCGIDPGCGWSERPLECLFASYLPDINWRVAGAESQFIADAIYWIDEFDVDGFRVDAVKHVETTSIYNLRAALQNRFTHGERIWMLGETAVGANDRYPGECDPGYQTGYEWIDAYTGEQALDGQFDFPTSQRVRTPILENGLWSDIDWALQDMQQFYKADASHVRFFGSHDSPRVASQAARDSALPCSFDDAYGCTRRPQDMTQRTTLNILKRAWTLLWTTPGTPLLYYGDEIAMPGANDPDNRRDMRWQGDLSRLNMSQDTVSDLQNELYQWFKDLASLRESYVALRRGSWEVLWVDQNGSNELYWYARVSDDQNDALVLIAFNQGGTTVTRSRSLVGLSSNVMTKMMEGIEETQGVNAILGQGVLSRVDGLVSIEIPAESSAIFVLQ